MSKKSRIALLSLVGGFGVVALSGCSTQTVGEWFTKPFAEIKVSAKVGDYVVNTENENYNLFTTKDVKVDTDLIKFVILQDKELTRLDFKQKGETLYGGEVKLPYYVQFTANAVEKADENYTYRVIVNGIKVGTWDPTGEFNSVAFEKILWGNNPRVKVYKGAKKATI